MLAYVTRGQTNPIGKQRVYFAASQDDFGYFNDVANHILRIEDVALYYDDQRNTENTTDREIESMALVVFILTRKAMDSSCDALIRVICRAYRKGIPVLPLAVEDGVGGLFSNFCSRNHMDKMHVLYPNKQDATALSFTQKLRDYLKKQLVKGEDREYIYRNFSTSAFLSYRKADRAYALEIMRLIHQDEKCRDCAIWYDEYLTAGESYDDEIRKFIDFCPIFLFLVTNNMIKEDNYAIREEFQRAKELGKNIIVVDMIAEEHSLPVYLLEGNRYVGLQDIRSLPSVIREFFQEKTFASEEDALNHAYYLGLAYIHGIGVEKEEEYGRSLVETAAAKGLSKAMDTMVTLCVSGKNRNIYDAISWQSHLKDYYQQVFQENKILENLKNYLHHVSVLGSYYEMIPDFKGMLDCSGTIIRLLQENEGWENNEDILETAVIACDKLGNVYYNIWMSSDDVSVDYLNRAEEYYVLEYRYALLYGNLVNSFRAKRFIYTPIMRIADNMSSANVPLDEVIAEYEKALALIHEADNETPCYDSRTDLFGCYQKLTELYAEKGLERAMPYARKMVEYARQNWLENYELIRCLKYAEALELISKLQAELKDTGEAVKNLNKASKARLDYIDNREACGLKGTDSIYPLICDYIGIFGLYLSLNDYDNSELALAKAEYLVQSNYGERGNVELLSNLLEACLKLGRYARNAGKVEKARKQFEDALYYCSLLINVHGASDYMGLAIMINEEISNLQ